MKRMLLMGLAAVLACTMAFAEEETKEKKKMPSTAKYFTSLKQAKTEAMKYDAPIFVVAIAKGTPMEGAMKKILAHKFFRELATKGFFVYTMRVDLSKKEKEADARTPKALYEKLSADDRALVDVSGPRDKVVVRKLPRCGMVKPDCSEVMIKGVDMPKAPTSPDVTYIGPYLQNLQSAAQAYGIDIEMSKEMRKYIENPPPEKKDKKKKR